MVARVLAGRYELVRFVGRGGMGEVWEGQDRVIGRRVAIKLLPHNRRDTAGAELFNREARTAGALNHPGVVTVHDFGQDEGDGSLFLVMEFLVGRDLGTVLHEDGPPPVAVAVDWVAQAAAALARAHEEDVVHRDLKPANLMLTPDGQVKILDFGIARFMESLSSSMVMGTFPYMPPERFDGHSGDVRSDLYSLGCVLHELLTGQVPFHAATSPASMMSAHLTKNPVPPGRVRSGVPACVDDLVMELLAKEPEDRPGSAGEVRDRLRDLLPLPTSGTGTADAATRTAVLTARDDAGGVAPAGPPGSLAPLDAPLSDAPTMWAYPPDPDTENPRHNGFVTRRRALWIGAGVATAGVGVATGLALFDRGDRDTPAKSKKGLRPWFEADGSKLSALMVDDGAVYIRGEGTRHGTVYALNRNTGVTKWSRRFESDGYAADSIPDPMVTDGVVFVDYESVIHALDAATGAKKWDYTVVGDWELKLAGGLAHVYVKHEEAIHALDVATGTEKWVSRGINSISDWHVSGNVHAYIDDAGNVRALDAATGKKKWDFTGGITTWLVMAGGMLYTRTYSGINALDAVTGKQKWEFHLSDSDVRDNVAAVAADGAVYVIGNHEEDSFATSVYALDAATGKRKWTAPDSKDANPYEGDWKLDAGDPMRAAGGALYVQGWTHTYALNPATGRVKWTQKASVYGEKTQLEAAAEVVCVGNHSVRALDAATGRQMWTSPIRSSSLLIAHEALYVSSKNQDAVYAFNTATGASLNP
ncbi:PQQ-binding-like beta-propeller repeat protein [Streptomyces sp. NPDC005970]|uniref:serine/threonine-protein kinase n=1 Tax=Streptomyces sp. NPDC005970 TaxID=3156723 RepID=UPI0033FA5B52